MAQTGDELGRGKITAIDRARHHYPQIERASAHGCRRQAKNPQAPRCLATMHDDDLGMSEHIQIRLISLLEEAANSFEQLETIANRELLNIPAEQVEDITFCPIERDVLDEDDEPDNEMDQLLLIRYRVHRQDISTQAEDDDSEVIAESQDQE